MLSGLLNPLDSVHFWADQAWRLLLSLSCIQVHTHWSLSQLAIDDFHLVPAWTIISPFPMWFWNVHVRVSRALSLVMVHEFDDKNKDCLTFVWISRQWFYVIIYCTFTHCCLTVEHLGIGTSKWRLFWDAHCLCSCSASCVLQTINISMVSHATVRLIFFWIFWFFSLMSPGFSKHFVENQC